MITLIVLKIELLPPIRPQPMTTAVINNKEYKRENEVRPIYKKSKPSKKPSPKSLCSSVSNVSHKPNTRSKELFHKPNIS